MSTSGFSIRYRAEIRRADGSLRDSREGHNLVMRARIADFFQHYPLLRFSAGDGTRANRVDSQAITFANNWADAATQFQLTASAGFFTDGMAGCTIRLTDGVELIILGVTSGTVATVDITPTAPTQAVAGVVHFDNQTGLAAPVAEWTKLPFQPPTHQRAQDAASCSISATFVGSSGVATTPHTIRELAWLNPSEAFSGRADLSAAPLNALQNDFITVTVVVSWVVDCAAVAVTAGDGNGDFSGVSRFYGVEAAALGGSGSNSIWPIKDGGAVGLFKNAPDISEIHPARWNAATIFGDVPAATASVDTKPAPSVVVRTTATTWKSGSGDIAALGFIRPGKDHSPAWVHKLNNPVSKTELQTLTLGWAHTLTRKLA